MSQVTPTGRGSAPGGADDVPGGADPITAVATGPSLGTGPAPGSALGRSERGPQHPWLHDLEIAVHGNVTSVSEWGGGFGEPGTGLYVDDHRVVDRLSVRVRGQDAAPIAAASRGNSSLFWGAARHVGDGGPELTCEVQRDRRLVDGGMTEDIALTWRDEGTFSGTLAAVVGGDGASIAEVKGDAPNAPCPVSATDDGRALTWSTDRHDVRVELDHPAARAVVDPGGGSGRLVVAVELTRGTTASLALTVRTTRRRASEFDADPGADGVDWAAARVCSHDERLDDLVETSIADLRELTLRDPREPGDVFVAAGTPWFLTLFGRDSIWAARFMLPFGTALAGGTLRALARRQGRVSDPASVEEPGKILHEVRRDEYVNERIGLRLPTQYYGTVDATSLWVVLLHDAWRWGLAEDVVADLLPNLERALGWMRRAAQASPDGLLRYVDDGTGLNNQGWKDSRDAMRRADGSIAPAPIALVEAQTYAVEAALGAAEVLDAFGRDGGEDLREWARALADRVRRAFWVERDGDRYLALAIDGEGNPVDGVASNMGHALGSGALTPQEARAVTATLTGPGLLREVGVATLSRDNPGYNPIGYHTGSVWTHDTAIVMLGMVREGHREQAARLVRALLRAGTVFDLRLPEVYAGETLHGRPAPYPASCRPQAWSAAAAPALVQALLGIEADVPGRRLRLAPMRPGPVGPLRVEGLRWAGRPFTVAVDDTGVTTEGLPDDVEVVVDAGAEDVAG